MRIATVRFRIALGTPIVVRRHWKLRLAQARTSEENVEDFEKTFKYSSSLRVWHLCDDATANSCANLTLFNAV